jgi:uncharacterized protein YndB with AHSA1/START domain
MSINSTNNTAATESNLLVKKTLTVRASQAWAFEVFTEHFGSWWPLETHHIGAQPAQTAVIEPRVGGRWFERGVDGSECTWGRVREWEPPHRLLLSWEISADFKCDTKIQTEVEVRFIAEGPDSTRIEFEHRHLEFYGDSALRMKGIFDSEGGWTGMLQRFAAAAAAAQLPGQVPCPSRSN